MNHDSNSRLVWTSDRGQVGKISNPTSKKKLKNKVNPAKQAGFPDDGVTRVRRETGGRGGKTVTVLYGAPGSADDKTRLCKELKQICGCGGAAKDGRIEIQGDHRDKIMCILEEKGIQAKAAGG